jgi:hypothetical protein
MPTGNKQAGGGGVWDHVRSVVRGLTGGNGPPAVPPATTTTCPARRVRYFNGMATTAEGSELSAAKLEQELARQGVKTKVVAIVDPTLGPIPADVPKFLGYRIATLFGVPLTTAAETARREIHDAIAKGEVLDVVTHSQGNAGFANARAAAVEDIVRQRAPAFADHPEVAEARHIGEVFGDESGNFAMGELMAERAQRDLARPAAIAQVDQHVTQVMVGSPLPPDRRYTNVHYVATVNSAGYRSDPVTWVGRIGRRDGPATYHMIPGATEHPSLENHSFDDTYLGTSARILRDRHLGGAERGGKG